MQRHTFDAPEAFMFSLTWPPSQKPSALQCLLFADPVVTPTLMTYSSKSFRLVALFLGGGVSKRKKRRLKINKSQRKKKLKILKAEASGDKRVPPLFKYSFILSQGNMGQGRRPLRS